MRLEPKPGLYSPVMHVMGGFGPRAGCPFLEGALLVPPQQLEDMPGTHPFEHYPDRGVQATW